VLVLMVFAAWHHQHLFKAIPSFIVTCQMYKSRTHVE
jgi:hypothetical protein